MQSLRLRVQHRHAKTVRRPGESEPVPLGVQQGMEFNPNQIVVRDMSELDRRILKEAFRQARKLQQRLEVDYP